MNLYFRYRDRILLTALVLSLILTAFLSIIWNVDLALSLLAGAFIGMLNFFLLAREIHKFSPGHGLRKAASNLMLTSVFRYGVMFVGFAVCISKDGFRLLPFCLGVFLVQMVIVANAFLVKEKKKEIVVS